VVIGVARLVSDPDMLDPPSLSEPAQRCDVDAQLFGRILL
jgi:hypothetical protein